MFEIWTWDDWILNKVESEFRYSIIEEFITLSEVIKINVLFSKFLMFSIFIFSNTIVEDTISITVSSIIILDTIESIIFTEDRKDLNIVFWSWTYVEFWIIIFPKISWIAALDISKVVRLIFYKYATILPSRNHNDSHWAVISKRTTAGLMAGLLYISELSMTESSTVSKIRPSGDSIA